MTGGGEMMYLTALFQEGPAQTTNYMIFGYAVIFGAIFLYIASLYLRRRNLQQDLEAMKDIQEE
jgi:CcmD family protein